MYGFPQHLTQRTQPPHLNITNCVFKYFLNNYESLIHVETEAYWKNSAKLISFNNDAQYPDPLQSYLITTALDFYYVNGADRGAMISISNSNFLTSRFCKGLIVYREAYFV